jgi:MSHA biogenesis protein MshP
MFPESLTSSNYKSNVRQQGFLLPLSVFIVVVMGLFALVLSRNTIQSNTSAVQEAISTQAFYAAESGAQRGMQNLFFPDARIRQQVDTRCVDMVSNNVVFTVPGLNSCTAVVSCTCRFSDDSNCAPITAANYSAEAIPERVNSFYRITSEATCGSKNLRSVRTIEVGAFLSQE